MAASGYTPIILFNSTTTGNAPTTSNLAVGELAINVTDGKLFFNQSGTIKVLANATYATSVSTISFGTTGLTPSTATNGVVTVAGTLAVANGGTGVTTSTGSGNNVLSTSPTLVTPILGTPTSVTLTNATGLPLTTGVTGTLPVANGGTNLTSFTANGVVYASSTSALATGSALTFDGTALGVSGTANSALSVTSTATTTALKLDNTNANAWGSNLAIFTGGTAAGYFGTIGSLLGSTAQDLTVYATASNGFRVYTNGNNERLRVTSGGNLGIGTSSPNRLLTVQATGTGTVANFQSNAGPNIAFTGTETSGRTYLIGEGLVTNGNFSIYDSTGSAERLVVDSSGNLGLGVTPSAWNTGKALEINAVGTGLWGAFGNTYLNANNYYNAADKFAGTGYAVRYLQAPSNGQHQWLVSTASGTAGNAITFTQAMTLDASGNLGIGTTSPSARLHVVSTTPPQLRIEYNSSYYTTISNNGTFNVVDASTGNWYTFQRNGTTQMVIDNSGNVGIGTSSPTQKLDVTTTGSTNSTIVAQNTTASNGGAQLRAGNPQNLLIMGTDNNGGGLTGTANASYFYTTSTSPMVFLPNAAEKMRLSSSGNLGIGTSSPANLLHLYGPSAVQKLDGSGNTGLACYQNFYSGGDKAYIGIESSSGSGIIASGSAYALIVSTATTNPLVFGTNSAERARIDSSGNLLIGYTSSNGAYKLQVNSQIFATSAIIATSDARYKTNVTPISNGLSLVNKLNPVSFDWKEHSVHNFDTKNTNVGFLAQDVQEVLKDEIYLNSVIRKNQTELPDGNKEEFLGLSDSSLIPILVKAIQEQQTLIESLTARLTALENK